jgi:hypothetical protein
MGGSCGEYSSSLSVLEGAANKMKFWVQAMLATIMQATTPKQEDDADRTSNGMMEMEMEMKMW